MNLSTIKGTIQSHTKKSFSLPDGGQLVDNTLNIDADGKKIAVHKYTKEGTPFDLASGTLVQASYDAQVKNGSKGEYTINKIIKDGLTILSGSTGESINNHALQPSSSSSTAKVTNTLSSSSKGSYDSNGARNGMITGKAVELAVARGTTSLDDLKQAAKDVLDLTFFVESGAKLEAKIKAPLKEVKKASAKPAVDLDSLDDQSDSFEFDS